MHFLTILAYNCFIYLIHDVVITALCWRITCIILQMVVKWPSDEMGTFYRGLCLCYDGTIFIAVVKHPFHQRTFTVPYRCIRINGPTFSIVMENDAFCSIFILLCREKGELYYQDNFKINLQTSQAKHHNQRQMQWFTFYLQSFSSFFRICHIHSQ